MNIVKSNVVVKPVGQLLHRHQQLYQRHAFMQAFLVTYDGLLWVFLLLILLTHVISQMKDTFDTATHVTYGKNPSDGPFIIPGNNDEPYTDRTLACVLRGRTYNAMQVSNLLTSAKDTTVTSTDGSTIDGYRLLTRNTLQLPSSTLDFWTNACNAVFSPMLTNISTSCIELGYNVVTDYLRIVDGLTNTTTLTLTKALPLLVMPVADNTKVSRFAIPSKDGSACVFRIEAASLAYNPPGYWMYSVNRTIREQKTQDWLAIRDGEWRNGWLTDKNTGEHWYSDLVSSNPSNMLGLSRRVFDLRVGEVDCTRYPSRCQHQPSKSCWSDVICVENRFVWLTSVAIANGSRSGLFYVDSTKSTAIHSVYNLSVIVANISILLLLVRWLVVVIIRYQSENSGNRLDAIGIGCLSNTNSFELLPILILPRMRNALVAFFTAGICFEGDQFPLAEAWFKIYPGIAEVVLFYFASLNLLAKLLRRRMTDIFFGPTLLFFCLMHWLRIELTGSGWYGFDSRVPTAISAVAAGKLTLWDLVSTNATLRIGGSISSLFALKLGILAVNALPLFVGDRTSTTSRRVRSFPMTHVERALGMLACASAGLGRSSRLAAPTLSPYELVRLGYLVVDGSFVLSISDWLLLVLVRVAFRPFGRGYSFRVLVIPVSVAWASSPTDKPPSSLLVIKGQPQYLRTDDAVFDSLRLRHLVLSPLQ